MASARQFEIDLYEEHLEEASFLYEQRLAHRHDPELTWTDLDPSEERLEAHIDALIIGGELALDVCRRRVREGDSGELHAALRVFCRQCRRDDAYALLRDLDATDAEVAAAATHALEAECPTGWLDELASIVARHPRLASVLAPVLGYRRAKVEPALLRALESADEQGAAATLRGLGRIGGAASVAAIEKRMHDENPDVSSAACLAAMRLGHAPTVNHLLLAAQARRWLTLVLAAGGSFTAVRVLLDRARSEDVTDDTLLGLGLLGDLGAVRTLFDCLAMGEVGQPAALALQLITGAELYEEVFVPEAPDPDEMLDEERQRYEETGEAPRRADGQPFGSTTIRAVTDQAVWKEWLSQNKSRFDPACRYRYGQPYSPRALLAALLAERVPNTIRGWIVEEFRLRYGIDFPMEIRMPVREQRRLLERMGQWVQANESKFTAGAWLFHGRLMP